MATEKKAAGNREARRAASRKKPEVVSDKPELKKSSVITLDDIEAESLAGTDDSIPPFEIELSNGKTITLASPAELHYSAMLDPNLEVILLESMSDEDYEAFLEEDFKGRQVAAIVMLWRRHYGALEPGE